MSRKLKGMDIRRHTRGSLWPAALVFLLVLASSAAVLRGGRLRDTDLARLGSLEAATSITESYTQDGSADIDEKSVLGWGVYTPDGTLIASRGSAPDRLDTAQTGSVVETRLLGGVLRTVRPMMVLGIAGSPAKHAGAGAGGGMRRLVLVDWDLKASGGNEAGRIAGVAGLSLTALLMLILQQRAAIRLAVYRRDEERRARLVQLGMAARTLTHEIRNPLGIIKVQTALLKKTLGPEAAEGLEMVDGEVNRLSTLTERVREWLADPAGKPEMLNAADEITRLIARLPWDVNFVKPEDTMTVKMDRSLFATTMENLIRNAVESQVDIPEASPPAVMLESDAHRVRLTVQDSGDGLPEGEKERLFDPFFTTKTQGSGVGLALSKQAVEAAGGTLTLKNRKEGGALAIIILPREQS